MKKFLTDLGTSCVVILLILLSLEGFLRATHAFGARVSWSDPDTLLGWSFVRNGHFTYVEENPKPVPFQTNQYGWKDKNWNLQKDPGTLRIAVLGDSYVESLQVEDSKNFLRLAEQKLAAQGMKTEWMNFGRSGATQTEEYIILRDKVLAFHPDVVILFFYPVNDIDDISAVTAPDIIRPFFTTSTADNQLTLDTSFNQTPAFRAKKRISFLKQHSALISLLSQRVSLLTQQKRMGTIRDNSSGKKLKGYLSLATQTPEASMRDNYALCKRLILEMSGLAKTNGIHFMLVTIDTPAYQPEMEAAFKIADSSFDPLFFEKDLASLALNFGMDYLGLESLFRGALQQTKEPLHWQYWGTGGRGPYWEYGAHTGHWNEKGHEVVAEALVKKVSLFSSPQKPASQS